MQLSEAFGQFFIDLANDLDASIDLIPPRSLDGQLTRAAAVLLAAGGAEREASDWLERNWTASEVPLIAVGADGSRRTAARLVGQGARDYFALPDDVEVLRNAVASAVASRRLQLGRDAGLESRAHGGVFSALVGESYVMRELLARATRLLPHAKATVLITGETGTGKELLARAVHSGGPRVRGPFVPINCSALPDHLVESELFGHERGAFTDAHMEKPGLFEVAEGGTLFLDEIGDLPLELQAKLLRVLDEREIRRVGGTRAMPVDVRVIAATNIDLSRAVEKGTFREDLFFRLSVITLSIPPLRERGEDVVLIAKALLERLGAEHGLEVPALSPDVAQRLLERDWPGNVRELKNSLERALLLSENGCLNLDELRPQSRRTRLLASPLPFPARMDEIIRSAARATLDHCNGNRSASARLLGITRKRLKRILDGRDQPGDDSEDTAQPFEEATNLAS